MVESTPNDSSHDKIVTTDQIQDNFINIQIENDIETLGEETTIGETISKKKKKSFFGKQRKKANVNSVQFGPTRTTVFQFGQEFKVTEGGTPLDYDGGDRNDFVRKVFTLTTIMLACVSANIVAANAIPAYNEFWTSPGNLTIFLLCVAFFIQIVLAFAMPCSDCTRHPPCNYICLIFVTFAYSIVCAFVTVKYEPIVIGGAAIITLSISAACLALAFTNFDFTKFLLVVIMAMLAITFASIGCGLLKMFTDIDMKPARIVITVASAVMTSVMLVIEFQMVLGGKSVELTEEDYALGAYMIFTSIIALFIRMLQILQYISGDDG